MRILFLFTLFLVTHSYAVELNKHVLVDCPKFCMQNTTDGKLNDCDGVFWNQTPKKQLPQSTNRPLYYYELGNRCARDELSLNGVKLSKVAEHCACESQIKGGYNLGSLDLLKSPIIPETKFKLIQLREKVKNWVLCHDFSQYGSVYTADSVKECSKINGIKIWVGQIPLAGTKVEGDHIYSAGVLCLEGYTEFCPTVKAAQDIKLGSKTYGAFFRSPATKLDPTYTGNAGTHFSRDMLTGLLMYFIKTKDVESAKLWIRFIAHNKKIPRIDVPVINWFELYYNLCPLIGGASKADDRCAILSDTWGLIYEVWKYLGIDNEQDTPREMLQVMRLGSMSDELITLFNSMAPTDGTGSYMGVLAAYNILIRKELGKENLSTKINSAQLANRSRYRNPFYNFLQYGPNEMGARQILDVCPVTRPDFGGRSQPSNALIRGQFIWNKVRYMNTYFPYGEFNVPGGEDCLEILSQYLGREN